MSAAIFCAMYPRMLETARLRGYALAIHGSMARDMDLVAIPWSPAPASVDELLAALCEAASGRLDDGGPRVKPHGRLAYVIWIGSTYIDLSVVGGAK